MHKDWINGLGLSRDEKRLISGDDAGLTIVWDLASKKPISQWLGFKGTWVTAAALAPTVSWHSWRSTAIVGVTSTVRLPRPVSIRRATAKRSSTS